MQNVVTTTIENLALKHDRIPAALVREKNIKLGLRNEDGTGVFVGITSKGQVIGYKKEIQGDGTEKKVDLDGELYYCGYNIKELVRQQQEEGRFGFEETTYLLLTGELPNQKHLDIFAEELAQRRHLPKEAKKIILNRPPHDDQMGSLHTIVSAMHLFDEDPNSTDIKDLARQCIDLVAKFPTIVAYNYLASTGQRKKMPALREPRDDYHHAENFLYMLKGKKPDRLTANLFDMMLVLHAEHGGGNNSTFTVRAVSSSGANSYMAICSGIASLSGRLHGGANEAVESMMENVKAHVKDWDDDCEVSSYLEKILDKKANDKTGKIYGIGHSVYTKSDPRALILELKAEEIATKNGMGKEFKLYKKVAVLAPRIVKEKKGKVASPNIDFYSGFVYRSMGIPKELFTPIFAMARVAGWSAHRIEEIIQGKLMRPSYYSSLPGLRRNFVPLALR
ncbi:MAG TPA: citrate synthase [Nitrospiraceae bacterium]|jgi:citrate synthase|nr:citrate synthase [Nitrospiraceae bacterium]